MLIQSRKVVEKGERGLMRVQKKVCRECRVASAKTAPELGRKARNVG